MKFTLPKLPDLSSLVGIDVGSSRIRVGKHKKEGFRYHQHEAVLAIDPDSKKIVAFGQDALEMKERVKNSIQVLHPIQDGVVYDSEQARVLIKLLLDKHKLSSYLGWTTFMASTPTGATMVEKQLIRDVLFSIGAKDVFTISQALAASIGAGVPIADSSGSFLLHIGASGAEAVAISLGSIVQHRVSARSGSEILKGIIQWFKKIEHLHISDETARDLLKVLSESKRQRKRVVVLGQDILKRNPRELDFEIHRLQEVVYPFFVQWSGLFKQLLATVPPQLTADIIDKGLLLSGEISKLDGLADHLVTELGVPVSVVEEPDLVVIKGIGTALAHLDEFKKSLGYLD